MRTRQRQRLLRFQLARLARGAVIAALASVLGPVGWARAQALTAADGAQARFALVVGNNLGNKPERALRYAEDEVTRLADILGSAGDFSQVEVLRGATRAALEAKLVALRARMAEARATGASTLFLFYYSGHGDNEALELGATRFPLRDLRAYMEELPADVRMAFVDACQSGALTGVKGGRRAPSYQVKLADPGTVRGMAFLTSSTANELSQESDELRGSFFSHHVMSGLRGAADSSRDGQVTLSELYQYAFQRTLAHTAATLVGGQHPTYETRLAGTGEVILTRTRPSDARLTFPAERGVTYTVFDGDLVVAEIGASPASESYLALPAGSYRVVRRALGSLRQERVQLAAGDARALRPEAMLAVNLDAATQRKKGADDDLETLSLRERTVATREDDDAGVGHWPRARLLGAHAGLHGRTIDGTGALHGSLGLSYLQALGAHVGLRARVSLATIDGRLSNDAATSFLRIAPALDLLTPLLAARRAGLAAGVSFGVPYVQQRALAPGLDARSSVGAAAGGVAAAFVNLGARAALWLELHGGAEALRLDGRAQLRPAAAVTLGATLGL